MQKIKKNDLPVLRKTFDFYKRKSLLPATRLYGHFEVETINGVIDCQDGYLAVDECGWPYPITVEVFERTYVRANWLSRLVWRLVFKKRMQDLVRASEYWHVAE